MLMPRILFRLGRIFLAYKKRSEIVRPLPVRLWVESASVCNLRCPMCFNKDFTNEDKVVMKYDLFTKIVDEAKGFVNDMYLHHRGEPLMNPRLFDMIAYARAARISTRFHTNGALLSEEKARKLLDAAPNLVSFSIDGFEKESYEKIRVGAEFEETIENIIRFASLKKELGKKLPYIVVEKIKFNDPSSEGSRETIDAMRKKLLDAGVDEVIEKDEYVWATEDMDEPEAPRTSSCCTFPWYAMVICANGTVTPCPQDFYGKMGMGNVETSSLREIWNGEAYRELRRNFRTNIDALSLCRKCDRLRRKTVGGIPLQYVMTFLIDQFIGYGQLRKMLGTAER